MAFLAEEFSSPDPVFADDLTDGMVLYGKLQNFGWWGKGRRAHAEAPPVHHLFADAAARRRAGDVPTSDRHLNALWDDLLEECKLG